MSGKIPHIHPNSINNEKNIFINSIFNYQLCDFKKIKHRYWNKKNESSGSTIEATKFSNSFTLEPVNLDKPILIGKDTIYNTRVIYNNSKETIVKKDTIVKIIDLKQEVKEKEKDYTEGIKSVSNRLFLLVIVLFILNKLINYFKPKIF